MSSDLVMPALGRPFTLGMLYDTRREKLIPGFSLFGDETLQQYQSSNTQRSSEFKIVASDSTESKSSAMDIEASLGVSFLGGLVEVGGSAKYLNNTKKYQNQSRVTLKYKATTIYKQFTAPPGTVKVQETVITQRGLATHVVTGILYGANAFFVFDSDKVEDTNLQDIQGKMEAVIKKIPTISIEGSASVQLTDEEKSLASNLSCKFHGDFLLESLPTTFEDAVTTYQTLPTLLGEDGASAVPMKVWLVPLKKFFSKAKLLTQEITVSKVRRIHTTLEELYKLKRRANEAMDDKLVQQIPLIHDKISNFHQIFQDYMLTVQKKIAEKLPLVRAGTESEQSLQKIIDDRAKSPFSNENVSTWLEVIEREIAVLKSCAGMVEGTQAKFVSNQTELDREVLAEDVKHALCFVFTSVERNDPYLKVLSDYLESPDSKDGKEAVPSTEDKWCFSTRVVLKMKQRAQTFCDHVNDFEKSRNVGFFVTALENGKFQGASIYHYKDGSLATQDFTFPRMPFVQGYKKRSDLLWYACDLTFDRNTINIWVSLSDNDTFAASEHGKRQNYPKHPERFLCYNQVLCNEGLTGKHYWEVEWNGYVDVGVAYISISRKEDNWVSAIGHNTCSWVFSSIPRAGYVERYNQRQYYVTVPTPGFKQLGVFLNWPDGSLSFYAVSSDEVHHLHTFKTKFTEPVYPAFCLGYRFDHGTVRLL
uniref:Neoverrucotoxin subunit alpha n=1 Tax=Synanceia verrucosa TaxID=51996 RepID=STXA_SYNVE|nr:RecName: Full=Neoverrucotoxin subunit alpha; Short=NeoVTX subunit alpha [Synanceia verrucosa]BAF41221.1 neoverrucotoxin a-subunit [Synanceia verrucosa]